MNQIKTFSKNAQKDFSLIDHILLYKSEYACSELMERYKKSVYHMILKKVPNQKDAEDLTIETFAKAFHKLALFQNDQGAILNLDLLDQNLVPDEVIINDQKIELVRLFVNQMESKYQRLITLRYFDELSYAEIAQLLNTPLGTIKAQLYRFRILLSNLLNNKRQHM